MWSTGLGWTCSCWWIFYVVELSSSPSSGQQSLTNAHSLDTLDTSYGNVRYTQPILSLMSNPFVNTLESIGYEILGTEKGNRYFLTEHIK